MTYLLINYLLLLGKWFNNNKKSMNKKIIFGEFMLLLKKQLYIISIAHNVKGENNKFQEKFGKVSNCLCSMPSEICAT